VVTEFEGRAVLKQVFVRAGLTVLEDFPLLLGNYQLLLDGYDPERRIGYEYITTANGDREALHEAAVEELDRLNGCGLLKIFLIDEQFIPDEATLREAAESFLQEHLGE
jgi:hypothetical protein